MLKNLFLHSTGHNRYAGKQDFDGDNVKRQSPIAQQIQLTRPVETRPGQKADSALPFPVPFQLLFPFSSHRSTVFVSVRVG
uniref:HDC09614 n=1 Tax=Drosophila melanogaster TaxID=7227 RepID=Q6ILD3_DROME|nr:TPA_inf: HDC09614 [Drosophila melanogaster]